MAAGVSTKEPPTEELVARAAELIPALRSRAAAAEAARRLPQESVEDMRRAELFKVMQPARYGGFARGFTDYLAIVDQVARGCGAAAWIYSNAVLHTWHLGMFVRETQDDVWASDPDAIVSSSYAPTGTAEVVDGGYRLRGTWNYASGCDNTTWSLLGARVGPAKPDEPPTQVWLLVPRADYRIEDNWQVMGLAATGSKNIVVDEAFVPAHRMLTVAQSQSGTPPGISESDDPVYRVPMFCSFSFFIAGPIVGMAQGALDEYVRFVTERTTRGGVAGGGTRMAEFPTIQLRIAEAEMRIEAARDVLRAGAAETLAAAATPEGVGIEQRFRNRRAQAFATRLAREAVDELFESAGASGVFLDNATQRRWRDVHAAAKHFSLNWDAIRLMCGQHRLGLEPAGMY